jgi:hypothetical protein
MKLGENARTGGAAAVEGGGRGGRGGSRHTARYRLGNEPGID